MNKSIAVLFAILILAFGALPPARPSTAQSMQAFFNAPAWKLEYQVSFMCQTNGSRPVAQGSLTYTVSIDRSFSAVLPLDMRNGGPNLMTLRLLTGPAGTSAPSAEQQAAASALIMRVDDIANWMNAGPTIDENASAEAQQAAMLAFMESGTARLEYTLVETGIDLVDEIGGKFNRTVRTTARGAGKVMVPTNLVFEMDTKAKRYLLMLPDSFNDQSSSSVKMDVFERLQPKDGAASESNKTSETNMYLFPGRLIIDDPAILTGQAPILEGALDPSAGKISGERSVPAHYEVSGLTFGGTLTFRYTLTPR